MDLADQSLEEQLMHYEWKLRQAERNIAIASNPRTIRIGKGNIKLYKQRISEIEQLIKSQTT